MTTSPPLDLREAWSDLLTRRASLAAALTPYGAIVQRWASFESRVTPLEWSADRCRSLWDRGAPLLSETRAELPSDEVETLLDVAMAAVAAVSERDHAGLDGFAAAWNERELTVADLLPAPGRIGSPRLGETGLRPAAAMVLVPLALRPLLEPYFAPVRDRLADRTWHLGICPCCGAPPGFSDVVEDGRRRLACQFCGGHWTFSRTRCPFCGTDATEDQVRLELGEKDEGYFITGCRACSSYLKELDRRTRWNGGPALVEDWGSPHFDLVARRQGYVRPAIALLELPDSA